MTHEEKETIKQLKLLKKEVDKIYERTDKVIKDFNKAQRIIKQKQRRIEQKKLETEQKNLMIQKELKEKQKAVNFNKNIEKFSLQFYEIFENIKKKRSEFEDFSLEKSEICKLLNHFSLKKCIHPKEHFEKFIDIGIHESGYGLSHNYTFENIRCGLCKKSSPTCNFNDYNIDINNLINDINKIIENEIQVIYD